MIKLKQILVPVDFSEVSEVALRYGCELARAFDSRIHLLHILEDPLIYAPGTEGYIAPPVNFHEEMEQNARQHMEKLLAAEDRASLDTELVSKWGSPFVEIVRYARSNETDLIVMGTHGRGPIAHMLLGSVAEKVVRKAPCPVLTVRHPEHEFVMP